MNPPRASSSRQSGYLDKKALARSKFELLRRAAYDGELTAAAIALLIVLIDRADKKGCCFPRYSTLAKDTGRNRSTVIRAANLLAERGYIQRTGRHNGKGNSSNIYRVVFSLVGAAATIFKEMDSRETRKARRRGRGAPAESNLHGEQISTGPEHPEDQESLTDATPGVAAAPPQEVAALRSITPPFESLAGTLLQQQQNNFEGNCERYLHASKQQGGVLANPQFKGKGNGRPITPGAGFLRKKQLQAKPPLVTLSEEEQRLSARYQEAIARGDMTEVEFVMRELNKLSLQNERR